jgi:transposase
MRWLKVFGAGQWLHEKHGAKSRRGWRKLHLAVDCASGQIVAHTLTEQDVDDPSQVAPLLGQIDGEVAKVIADGAYDGAPTYQTIAQHGDGIEIVIPPRSTAVRSCEHGPPTQRDRHLGVIGVQGNAIKLRGGTAGCKAAGRVDFAVLPRAEFPDPDVADAVHRNTQLGGILRSPSGQRKRLYSQALPDAAHASSVFAAAGGWALASGRTGHVLYGIVRSCAVHPDRD